MRAQGLSRRIFMPLSTSGVRKGTVRGPLRNADDDHYQLLVEAGGEMDRIAVNVKSSAPKSPSTVLFQTVTALPAAFTTASMKPVPPDAPGVDNDLKDKVEAATLKAMATLGAQVFAFGAKWVPEKTRADQYFKFKPGNGIHDIHMNQGNAAPYLADNGTWQDGALVFGYPGKAGAAWTWRAFFFAFQSQSFRTDDQGNRIGK
jgi:uncharacterized protein YukJ